MSRIYSISQFGKRVGKSITTLRRWDSFGRLIAKKHKSRHIYYDESEVRKVLNLAPESDETGFKGLRPHKTLLSNLRKLNKSLARKVKFSQNWKKAKLKLSRLHFKIANIRKDYLHKMTAQIVRTYKVITVEDLNTSGMLKNHKLARSIANSSFSMFKTILTYKAKLYGVDLVLADRFFASSKTCSKCNYKKEKLPLGTRVYQCDECGLVMDRDLNASINLDKFGLAKLLAVGSTV